MTFGRIIALFAILLTSARLDAQPTVRLEGRLVHVEGQETGRTDLSFGPFGTTVTRSDGFFTHVFPSETSEAIVEILDSEWTVLYPRGGRMLIPRTDDVVVEVIVGDPLERVITRTLAEKHQRLLAELTSLGAEQDQIRDILESFLDEVTARLDVDEAELRQAIDLAAERNTHYPEIAAALRDYILKAKDLKDAFRLLADLAPGNPGVVHTMESALLAYNEAHETINNHRAGFEQAVAAYWDNELLTSEFRALMDYALGEIHRSSMLRLNDSLVGIHRLQEMGRSRQKKRGAEISREINRIVADLEPRLAELDRRTERMLQALFTE